MMDSEYQAFREAFESIGVTKWEVIFDAQLEIDRLKSQCGWRAYRPTGVVFIDIEYEGWVTNDVVESTTKDVIAKLNWAKRAVVRSTTNRMKV
jgi:hypothetical protein